MSETSGTSHRQPEWRGWTVVAATARRRAVRAAATPVWQPLRAEEPGLMLVG